MFRRFSGDVRDYAKVSGKKKQCTYQFPELPEFLEDAVSVPNNLFHPIST